MDDTHQEFYLVVFRLLTAEDGNALERLDEFEAHASSHFEQEEQWMKETNFPARDCHIEEHSAVLRSVEEVRQAIKSGHAPPALVQDLALHLFQWFPGHADYLDSALAAWMTKRSLGGAPVVLRRSR